MSALLKFSIVTPSYNSQRFIRETIESVISQKGDFSIEYIIVDNCSTDRTKQIVEEYIDLLELERFLIKCNSVHIEFVSDKDSSMYEAIQKGFDRATGDVYAWINSDDIYLQGAFDIIQRTFFKYPQIQWLKGITSYLNENSNIFAAGRCNLYRQDWINKGLYGTVMQFIQQDSVFWRAELWDLSGGIDSSYSVAGDFALWRKFAGFAPLYSLNAYLSCFRKVPGQKSEDIEKYWQEVKDINGVDREKFFLLKFFLALESHIPIFLKPIAYGLFFGKYKYHRVVLADAGEPIIQEGICRMLKEML